MSESFFRYFFLRILLFVVCVSPQLVQAKIPGRPTFEIGWFVANQGKSQHVDIEGLIGDDFSVTQSSDQNLLIGLGYYFNGLDKSRCCLQYGINAFYLAPTTIKGNVTQEDVYTNLSYRYFITNFPIYFATKAFICCKNNSNFVFDLGIGPNIIRTRGFKEKSRDGGITIPDRGLFSGKTTAAFTAMVGLGWQMCGLKGFSFEIGYRFYYLGQGEFAKNNSQLKNNLYTGNSYANAFIFSISI